MKSKVRENKPIKNIGTSKYGNRDYYFHADEDFREDRDWGKTKTTTVKALAKPTDPY
ncbi:hypothetical protein HDC92_000075 [Pedobacter sp. AK017]|uniref:hypothetical protein n=1 Tax=Pedobacter sp. AK017 TaxID=2723073 RepID=UPI00160F73F2|nr:hypothetical protein [Pedobacter sp. AK017]MBB5436411.1 hypothetical protein [Pedobacter sp. AK017]